MRTELQLATYSDHRLTVSPSHPLTPSPSHRLTAEQDMFSAALSKARTGASTPQERAREAAEGLVATALIHPVLKQLRESNQAAAPFAPGPAERSFGQIMDATLAQRMVKSANWPLVESLARGMLRQMGLPTDVGISP